MNSLTLTGNLGKDAETRYLADGTAVLGFSVADSMGRDKPSIWWNCALFGKRAESLGQYLTKGQQVTVVGTVTEREFTDKDGQKRKSMDVRVQDIALQGGKRDDAPRQQAAPRQEPQRQAAKPAGGGGFEDMDDDIPFANAMRGAARCLAM
jgi:single-strand DNA-binding protein